MVISTALFEKPPVKNLIVKGLVLAEDGQNMSRLRRITMKWLATGTVVPKLVKFINNLTNWYEQEKIEKKKEGKLIAGLHWKLCSEGC